MTVEVEDEADTEFIFNALFELGAASVSTTDLHQGTADEDPLYGEPPQSGVLISSPPSLTPWKHARITALFPLRKPSDTLLMTIASALSLPATPKLRMYTEPFQDRPTAEWIAAARAFLRPVPLGRAAIVFPWDDPIPGAVNVVLDPGMAFGTGEHATTQLCARWIIDVVAPGTQVLDFGTGSGVLAILSVMLQERVSAVGVDIDPDAVRVARSNAERNKVQDRVHFCENGEEPEGKLYDTVVANILAGPLKLLAEGLVSKLKVGGRIALSGVIVSQAEEMRRWYESFGVEMENASVDGGWVLLVGKKR